VAEKASERESEKESDKIEKEEERKEKEKLTGKRWRKVRKGVSEIEGEGYTGRKRDG